MHAKPRPDRSETLQSEQATNIQNILCRHTLINNKLSTTLSARTPLFCLRFLCFLLILNAAPKKRGCSQEPAQTQSPPPFRLASLINRKKHAFPSPTHHRKTELLARASTGEAEGPFGRLLRRVLARAVVIGSAGFCSPGQGGQTEWRWGDR